jgi:nicotinate-nucleotide pyrophosphorylase (carboxylating)
MQGVAGRLVIQTSGNMALPHIAEMVATGIDYILAGAVTH